MGYVFLRFVKWSCEKFFFSAKVIELWSWVDSIYSAKYQDAEKLLEDENYFACTYVLDGMADALVGSKICSTAALMKPALQILRQKGKIASEVVVFYSPKHDKAFFTSDCSMNIDPSPEERAQVAINAINSAKAVGLEPKCAFISFSTNGSGGNHPNIESVRESVAIVKKEMPDVLVDGELQIDAAVSPYACKRKCPDSSLKGDANVLVFPDLNSGNIFAHSMGQFSELKMIFSMLPGLKKPVGILGRSTPTEFVVNMIYAVAMEANVE